MDDVIRQTNQLTTIKIKKMIKIEEKAIPEAGQRIALSDKMVTLFTDVLNEVHAADFSQRFYRVLLEDHVRIVVHLKHQLDAGNVSFKPDNFALRFSLFQSSKEALKRKLFRQVKCTLLRRNRSKRREVLKNYNHITFGFSGIREMSEDNAYQELPTYIPFLFGNGESSKREVLLRIAERYDDPFIKNAVRLLPRFAVEHFEKIYNQIELSEPEKKTFHASGLRFQEHDCIFVAKYIENGARLIWYQNGAETVEYLYQYARHFQYAVSDEFRTWGWKREEKDVPWVAYPLKKFKRNYQSRQKEKRYDFMLCYPKINAENREVIKNSTNELLQHVNSGYRFLVRPHPSNRKKGRIDQLNFIEDDRVTVSSGSTSIVDEMLMCETIIQMVIPSTNFLECICVDKPSLGLLLNEHTTEIVKPYHEFFQKNDVFHKDMQSMANHINNADLQIWWDDLMNDEKVRDFKRNFTNVDSYSLTQN
ncbi:MAG: hypothetical protein EA390_12750 [Balneolaceae bacterium]|nr:MAG: hypothetical protein EA390_12750 [Balneolaceae bacterium]